MPEGRVKDGDKVAADVDVGNLCTARGRLGGVLLGLLSGLALDSDDNDNDRLRPEILSGVRLGLGDLEGSTLRRARGTKPTCPRSLGVRLVGATASESRRRRFAAGVAGEVDRDLERPWDERWER